MSVTEAETLSLGEKQESAHDEVDRAAVKRRRVVPAASWKRSTQTDNKMDRGEQSKVTERRVNQARRSLRV